MPKIKTLPMLTCKPKTRGYIQNTIGTQHWYKLVLFGFGFNSWIDYWLPWELVSNFEKKVLELESKLKIGL